MTVAHRLAPAALLLAGALSPALAAPPPAACPAKTCKDAAPLITRVYPVADLVMPVGDPAAPACPAPCAAPACDVHGVQASKDGPAKPTEDKLVEILTHTVAPGCWAAAGGLCRVEYLPLTLSLVVSAAPDVQEQVADLLAALRRLREQEVAVEFRIVTVADNFFERVLDDPELLALLATPSGAPTKVGFLDGKQLCRFLERVQGDVRTNVLQTPKMTVYNGQTSTINVADRKFFLTGVDVRTSGGRVVARSQVEAVTLGTKFEARPVISADRRFVRVHVKGALTSLDSDVVPLFPVTVPVTPEGGHGKPVMVTQYIQQPSLTTLAMDTTLAIPDGHTAVLHAGKRLTENRKEYGEQPILSKIPYLNRLFKNTAYRCEPEDVLILVTPRIIVQEEEEERQTGVVVKAGAVSAPGDPVGYEVVEEQEETGCCHEGSPCCHEGAACCAAAAGHSGEVGKLVKAYHAACAAGRRDEATSLAVKALALDPTCFSKPCCTTGTAAHPTSGH